jgi:hypothetical protein
MLVGKLYPSATFAARKDRMLHLGSEAGRAQYCFRCGDKEMPMQTRNKTLRQKTLSVILGIIGGLFYCQKNVQYNFKMQPRI